MHVLIVDRSGPIPVQKYGGTDRVIWGLGICLHRLGYQDTFLVPNGKELSIATVLELDLSKGLNEKIPENVGAAPKNSLPDTRLPKPYLITIHRNPVSGAHIDINTFVISENQEYRYNSEALIFPIEKPQLLGPAMIERLYAGCAVFGKTNGALKELIVPEIGVVSDTTETLIDSVQHFEFDPVCCHNYAVTNFHSEVMTNNYIKWYDHILAENSINT